MIELSPFVHTPEPAQTTIERLVAMAIFTDSGKWWGSGFGSKLYELSRETLTPSVAQTAASMIRGALQPLEVKGVLSVVSVETAIEKAQLSCSITVLSKSDTITVRYDDTFGVFYGS